MADHSWSWSTAWKDSAPEPVGNESAKYEDGRKTCTLKVKLEPNATYGYWLNSENFHGFQDRQGHPAVPYLLAFQTRGSAGGIPSGATRLGYVGEKSDDKRSLADSGHAVVFDRPEKARSVVAIQIYASRYGLPQPPNEDFHVWLLDKDRKVLKEFRIPYAKIARGPMRWYTLELPSTEVPERFCVALYFNAEQTKGIYLGVDKNVKESHSYFGVPAEGFEPVGKPFDWMVRVYLSAAAERDGKRG